MTTTDLTLNYVALSAAVPEAAVVDVHRQLVGARRHNRVTVPGRAGSWHYDEQPGDRNLDVSVHIAGDTFADRRAAVRALAYWADVGAVSRLIVDDEPDRYHEAILANGDELSERLLAGNVGLSFITGPYALANAVSSETLPLVTGGAGAGSFAIPDLVTAEPVVEVTPAGSALTALTLVVNGYALSWAGNVPADDTLTISSISDTVTLGANDDVDLVGAYDSADLDMADVSGEFPLLLEGTTTWSATYTGASAGINIALTWRERFR